MANTRTYVHDTHTVVNPAGDEIVMFHKSTLMDVVTDSKSSVNAVGKIIFSAVCDTAAATAAKVVSVPGYTLVSGGHLTVKFKNGISVANATLNVNNTGAKAIMLNDNALPAGIISANNQIILQYNGTSFDIVGGAGSTQVNKNNAKKIYFIGVDSDTTSGTPSNEYFNSTVYLNAAGNTLIAPYFEGDGSNLRNLDASNINSGSLNAARLSTSGVTPGSYGSSAAATLGFGDTFKIPYITVDKYGRATTVRDISLTLPNNPDTDVKVTSTANNSKKFYINGTENSGNSTGTLIHNTGVYVESNRLHAGTAMQTPTMYFNSDTQYINGTSYTGQAATVGSISGHLEDSLTSTATNKAATANAARRLSASITSVSNTVSSLDGTVAGHTTSINSLNTTVSGHTTSISNINTEITKIKNAINSLVGQLGPQATYTVNGTSLAIITSAKPSVTI